MIRLRTILMLVAVLLGLTAVAWSQSNNEETRAFDAAMQSFQDEFWARAEKEWADFRIKFPQSARLAEAILLQGRALVEMGNYPGAVQLLQDNLAQAREFSDEYLFWVAESHFRAGQYTAAAENFARLAKQYPQSPRALESVLGQAASRGRQKQWHQVIAILQAPEGVFRKSPQTVNNHELLARGQLLLAEAYLSARDFASAQSALADSRLETLDASLQWQREYLLARTLLAVEQPGKALAASTNLVVLATSNGRQNLLAEALLFQGQVLERMDLVDRAVTVYRQNLSTNAPPSAQRQTLLRLSDLLISRGRLVEARSAIEQFLSLNPESGVANLARLSVAELKLREQLRSEQAGPGSPQTASGTNLVAQAIRELDELIQATADRDLRGKAYLNRGWGEWMRGRYADSSAAFEQAALLLPRSENQATARFKWADSRYHVGDFEGALTNYEAVVQMAPTIGGAALDLIEPALYQTLRSGLQMERPDLTTNALSRLLEAYPDGFLASAAVLLTGQQLQSTDNPKAARQLLLDFLQQSPGSTLDPEIRLAVARTHEAEGDWAHAIEQYDSVLKSAEDVDVRARAEYFRALDTALSGNGTNALVQFTNFVATHATSPLAPRAQWWLGDYFWQLGDYNNAELNYQYVFGNWPKSPLAYDARMMAGRAAMARLSLNDARNYITNLTSDLNCPPKLKSKAMFAYGDFLMRLKSANTNDALANFIEAKRVYESIERNYPSNSLAVRARGMIGQCFFQFAAQDASQYTNAWNAWQEVLDAPWAEMASRSQAEVGQGMVLEKLAQTQSGDARKKSLQQALDHYLNVFYYEKNLRDGEEPDLFWIKKAGLEAGRLAESLQAWPQALKLYQRLQTMIPALKPTLKNKILKAQEQLARTST